MHILIYQGIVSTVINVKKRDTVEVSNYKSGNFE